VAAPSPAGTDLLTIDQLAGRTGVSVRTIRFYATKGLLPPPELRGRLGLYGAPHQTRLELVCELTAMGFTLAAIERFLSSLPTELDVEQLVLQRALLAPWVPERLEEIDRAELDRRAGRGLEPGEVDSLEALGAVRRQPDGTLRVHGAASLTGALASLDLGLPPEVLARSNELIARHTAALADELMALFEREVLQPYRDRGRPVGERARLLELFTRLKPITVQGVVHAFGRAVNRAIRERYTDNS
jgi:DNA-binding transcriptional MerR regulator